MNRKFKIKSNSGSVVIIMALAIFSMLDAGCLSGFAQGALTPPGAPAPTMKTLAQIEPRTPIASLPYTITNAGSYYVTANLVGVAGQVGILISTNNVTLDLGGFALSGVPSSTTGIFISGSYSNIVVRNGTITGWGGQGVNGYTLGFPRNVIYEHLAISGNGTVGLNAEAGSIIRDCVIMNNGSDGISSVGSLITGCITRDNLRYGMNVTGSTIRLCTVQNNGTGINADHTTVSDCDIMNNSMNGLNLSSACCIINNRIADHVGNPGNALFLTGTINYIAGNAVINNNFGLYTGTLAATNNCIIQNRFLSSLNTSVSIYDIFPTVEPAYGTYNFATTNSLVNLFFP
ncbi:MAG: right-handed parallel beta-helix repeat-containing protein [Verrucomicrobiae bacterium]|nr:right-handed parallel beta-helix repeat-containing protein [Verrucomicrobiae bacterium]